MTSAQVAVIMHRSLCQKLLILLLFRTKDSWLSLSGFPTCIHPDAPPEKPTLAACTHAFAPLCLAPVIYFKTLALSHFSNRSRCRLTTPRSHLCLLFAITMVVSVVCLWTLGARPTFDVGTFELGSGVPSSKEWEGQPHDYGGGQRARTACSEGGDGC